MNVAPAAEVEPAGRVLRHDDPRPALELPRDHQLLLIAAAQRAARGVRARGARSPNWSSSSRRAVARRPPVDPAPADPRLRRARAEHHVLGQREVGDQSFGGAVLGDERHRARDLEPAAERRRSAGHRAEQLALAVALDRRDADDLARRARSSEAWREPGAALPRHVERRRSGSDRPVAPGAARPRRRDGRGRSPIIAAARTPACVPRTAPAAPPRPDAAP